MVNIFLPIGLPTAVIARVIHIVKPLRTLQGRLSTFQAAVGLRMLHMRSYMHDFNKVIKRPRYMIKHRHSSVKKMIKHDLPKWQCQIKIQQNAMSGNADNNVNVKGPLKLDTRTLSNFNAQCACEFYHCRFITRFYHSRQKDHRFITERVKLTQRFITSRVNLTQGFITAVSK